MTLNDSISAVFETKATLGSATLFAQASAVDVFLDEIERTVSYRYMCNEQMASRLKMLVAKKHIFDLTGREFEDPKLAQDIVKRLIESMNGDGLWGWWDKGRTDTLISRSHETLMGSIYWGEEDEKGVPLARFTRPYGGSVDATLGAYRIPRQAGGYEAELEKIRNYFFEIRRGGFWRNTYESANILETIMPDMLGKDSLVTNSELTVNGEVVKQFPHKVTFDAGKSILVDKKGGLPIFLTVYQQAHNERHENDDNGLSGRTSFSENGKEVSVLTTGKTTHLDIDVIVRNEAQYVMIEVPILRDAHTKRRPVVGLTRYTENTSKRKSQYSVVSSRRVRTNSMSS